MNKKIIKYLTWIILIVAILILMPIKQTMAAEYKVSYSDFEESENYYCLNKGYPFHGTETFNVFDILGNLTLRVGDRDITVDRDVLEYIITEASTTYDGRTSVGNYIPQHAIWKLVNTSISSPEGDKLIARANAYNNYISNKKDPIIEKEGSNKVVIYYREYEGIHNGVKDTYTNFKSIIINGNALSIEPTDCDYKGYNKKVTYTNTKGLSEAEVTVYYETKRDATLRHYISGERGINHTSLVDGGTEYFRIIGDECYHSGCQYYQDPMTKKIIEDGFQYHCKCKDMFTTFTGNDVTVMSYSKYSYTDNILGDQWDESIALSAETKISYNPQDLLYGDGSITDDFTNKTIKFGVNLTINKVDLIDNNVKIPNVKFKIEFNDNVSSIDGHTEGTTVYATTDGDGQIAIKGILPKNYNSPIIATITEVQVPNVENELGWRYYVKSTPTTVKIEHVNGSWKVTEVTEGNATCNNGNVTVTINNQSYIDLGGKVWEDGQIGEKGNLTDANGEINDTEQGLEGVEVYLCNSSGTILGYKNDYTKNNKTDINGEYVFKDVPRINGGYRVVFKYNGITYIETPQGTVSKASESEIDRTGFNNNFKTISYNNAESQDKTKNTILEYTYNNEKSTLNSTTAGHTTGTTDAKFQMSAQTQEAYNKINKGVHCGLVKKNFDIALGTDVKSATIKINGKTTDYTYAEIMNGELNSDFDKISSGVTDEKVTYNLNLYSSDYNYRIKDYVTDLETDRKVNSQRPEVGYTETEGDSNTDRIKEIEAYVTYSVILKNQTTHNATVNEFVYYYDEAYTPYNIVSTDKYDVSIDTNARKITFTSKNNGFKLTSPNYRVEVDLTFKILDKDGVLRVDKTATNIAEITEYSTDEGGLIDKDSAPANGIANGRITQYEDDTDEAKGLNIVLRKEETRAIVGTVFADTDKNGNNANGTNEDGTVKYNEGVNDVIVQLIEIKKISGKYYEYIWQETRSGSNEVKTTAKNGYTGTTYRYLKETEDKQAGTREYVTEVDETGTEKTILNIYVEEKELNTNGEYKFVDFIPGNYIIRYIYGDGKTYDITSEKYKASADNVKTYNGQDYKSTKDPNYNKPWYNTAGYTAGDSIARDNEARRLEVMTYSTTIDKTKGENLANKTTEALDATWMCAETSRINIPVDADNKVTETNNTTASYEYTNTNTKVLFGDMNFGLALRPQENIVLEKHITALKITPSGTGVHPIVDAKAKDLTNETGELLEEAIQRIVNGETVEVEGVTNGLAIIKSTAAERGFWQVETDVEELMQGAELEVEYTYVIRNDSDKNYLSNTLIQAYEKQDIKPYNETLDEIVNNTIKPSMKSGTYSYSNNNVIGTYLGEFYYTEDAESARSNDKLQLVSARVEKFEEALNNDLAFDETEGTSFKVKEPEVNKKYYVYGVDKTDGTKETEINTVVENVTVSKYLTPTLDENHTTETADWTRTITLRTTLSTVGSGKLGAVLPSHIAEVLQYSNAAGRKDMTATPANLEYVHSDDTKMTIENDNEQDEFWAESIIITKPTGEDKLTPIQIVLITISAIAVLGAGIVLIKKYVLKK